jgi:glycosyltransferase involved in cell wall biosynthesis
MMEIIEMADPVCAKTKVGGLGDGPWICCQLGAREHYAVPRALLAAGMPCQLVTDAWVQNRSPLGRVKRSLRDRYHRDIAEIPVNAWNWGSIVFELRARLTGLRGWALILARNRWFQRQVVKRLRDYQTTDHGPPTNDRGHLCSKLLPPCSSPVLFAYSYAALEPFRFAKKHGWRTVLGQVDPGPSEERIVARLYEENPLQHGQWRPAPPGYWADWREECRLADHIVVNSTWSQQCLIEEGAPAEKLRVIPLAYEAKGPQRSGVRDQKSDTKGYPERFTPERPLRALFLGQINLRKGVGPLMDAARLLRDEPVEFWMVGPIQIEVPADLRDNPKFRWTGPVPRSAAVKYYRDADVFLFPTFSDGFGLTQLEAQARQLPIVATKFCGEVVRHGVNGVILAEVSAHAISSVLIEILNNSEKLRRWSANSDVEARFSMEVLSRSLGEIFASE